MRLVYNLCYAAAILWFIIFSPLTAEYVNFWYIMSFSAAFLALTAIYFSKDNLANVFEFKRSYIFIGVGSAVVLYLIFFFGNMITSVLFPFGADNINAIYSTRSQASPYTISFLLVFLIGPAEEIFWRGFIQRKFATKYGSIKGFVIATLIYTLIHIWAFNLMLILAALVAGAFWGYLYMRYRSVIPGIISHAIWDLAMFIIIPIN